jgi:hypothetical protein
VTTDNENVMDDSSGYSLFLACLEKKARDSSGVSDTRKWSHSARVILGRVQNLACDSDETGMRSFFTL